MRHVAVDPSFRQHLLRIADISERDLDKLIQELGDHWSEPQEGYVRRRHRELLRDGVPSRLIYGMIRMELPLRRFPAHPLSERQVRRLIYG